MNSKIKHFAAKIKTHLAARRAKLECRDKKRKLFQAGLVTFNNGATYLVGNRENGNKTRVNVDRTYLFN